ncbi:hypothetical protein GSI_08739 [Ganoderma sinense ZZ0214-1]|uniref:Uncharacterized protein n=1 Tax=Ganoderma sinense ZZ0214-1 TaxID=1077348 RepID=A0A2G8S4M0_9APHY|nr:hypothetical protein GSI_08739 [Ganoderma sinense ZZ0214-1]
MRLLDTHTGQFEEKDPGNTEYAVLSHTWKREGEQTYHDVRHIQARFPSTHSRQPPSSHPREGPPLSFGEHPDSSARFNLPVSSDPIPDERTPLLPAPARPDSTMEQGLLSGTHHEISRFRQLQLIILRPFQWVQRFATLLACGCRRRPVEPTISDHSPHSSSAPSTASSTRVVTYESPSPLRRGLSTTDSGVLGLCFEGEPSPEGKGEMLSSLWDDPQLSSKVRQACAVARANGFRFIWIDACCIDRSNSIELSQAVSSLYSLYASAAVCYAYLADVPADDDHAAQGSHFRSSRWFARGWTLPELVAPRDVTFLSRDWQVIGSKSSLADLVEEITGIGRKAFLHRKSLDEFSVAQRLSWASQRETLLVEDEAYPLLGVFGVDMPILYGEGERAFRRLQEEIIQRVPDQSIFAWGGVYTGSDIGMPSKTPEVGSEQQSYLCCAYNNHNYQSFLATSPSIIEDSARSISAVSHDVLRFLKLSHPDTFEHAPSPWAHGFRTQFQMIPLSQYFPPHSTRYDWQEMAHWRWYLAILACEHEGRPGNLLGRVCYTIPPSDCDESGIDIGIECLRPGYVDISPRPARGGGGGGGGSPDLFPLSPETIERCRPYIETRTVYI